MPEGAAIHDPTFSPMLSWGIGSIAGAVGLLLYIGSYSALQTGLIRGDGYLYPVFNLVAAVGVLVSLTVQFNLHAALTQTAWIAISLVGITRLYLIHKYLTLSDDEQAAVQRLVPGLAKDRARKLLGRGTWTTAPPGDVLTTEGEPVHHLTFIADGVCRIEVQGETVASIGTGGLVGEMTYHDGQSATATVVVEATARLLHFDRSALGEFLRRNEDIRSKLEHGIAGDLRSKLAATSRALADRRRNMRASPPR